MADKGKDQFDQWLQIATRYFVLINAGGSVAVLSFMGASLADGKFSKLALVPLLCFAAGLVVAGFVIFGQLTGAYRALLGGEMGPIAADASIKKSWVTRLSDWIEGHTGTGFAVAFALFILGAVTGLIALLLW